MALVSLDHEYLTVRFGWLGSVFARRRSVRVPLRHVTSVRVRPELPPPLDLYADGFWNGIGGRPLPGVCHVEDEDVFCEGHDPHKVIAIDLRNARYGCLVVQVEGDSPEAVAARILSAKTHAEAAERRV